MSDVNFQQFYANKQATNLAIKTYIYHGNRTEYGLYCCEQANLLLFVLTLWNLRSWDSLQGRQVEHVLRCFFLADILQHYEQANVGSLKATKCKLQRAYAGHGGHIAQMPR